MIIYKGKGIGSLKASGKLKIIKEFDEKSTQGGEFTTVEKEEKRLNSAKNKVREQIEASYKRALIEVGEKEAQIFEIHLMMLDDLDYNQAIIDEIKSKRTAEEAIERAKDLYVGILRDIDDRYLSERASDIIDLSNQLKKALAFGEEQSISDTSPYILIARDLTPSQTIALDKSLILGFVTSEGTESSHTAILARAMGIPALVGVGQIDKLCDGEIGLLDSSTGTLVVQPSGEQIVEFERKKLEENKIKAEHEKYLRSLINKPAVSKGGHRVLIYANIGGEYDIPSALENGAEGIGLLRSEFLYLSLDRLPTEEELFESYRSIVTKMEGRRVIIRTLDIGADKQISYFNLPMEENPALGFRGVRVCLERQDIFKSQLKAILRASAYGAVSIMIPMIISVDEVRECKKLIEACKHELFDENREFDSKIEVGIMIETPAAAIMCKELAKEVDFFSVGTNDLMQYTLAVDRQNPKVASLCESNCEPVLRLIKRCADAIHENDGWIGVCGELSANLSLTERFVDMKIDELSMSSSYLLGIRKRVGECK